MMSITTAHVRLMVEFLTERELDHFMIDFLKEAGLALVWLFVGYLVGEKKGREK